MAYFSSRELAGIAVFSSVWGVANGIFAPMVFRATGLPILCDMVGFAILILTVWWIGKLGAATMVGLIATMVNLLLNPAGVQFLGFTAASIVFDIAATLVGHDKLLRKPLLFKITLFMISVLSASVAGLIMGPFFMAPKALVMWGGVMGWIGLHAAGGVIGGLVGIVLVEGLAARGLQSLKAKNR